MQSNVISFVEKRRERAVQQGLRDDQSRQGASTSTLLSLNLANWLANNFSNIEDTKGYDPDLQVALHFARGRVLYYRNELHDAASTFAVVNATAESEDLRILADLAYANAAFSMGDFDKAHSVCKTMNTKGLPEALKKCTQVLKANVLYAKGVNLTEAATLYRKALCESSRRLWIRNLQINVASAMPSGKELDEGHGLTRLRDILDAFIEMAASRYFASLVVTLG